VCARGKILHTDLTLVYWMISFFDFSLGIRKRHMLFIMQCNRVHANMEYCCLTGDDWTFSLHCTNQTLSLELNMIGNLLEEVK